MDCAGKTFVVFGGLGGIGFATCNSLLSKGAKNLGIFDIVENAETITKLVESFPSGSVKFWKVDAHEKSEIEQGFKKALSEFKVIDTVVNCVGIIDEARPERCIEINLLASVYINYAAIDFMSSSKGGHGGTVVNVASVAGVEPFSLCPIYCATKFGLVGLTRSLGSDFYFERTKIKFIAICPGITTTPLVKTEVITPIHNIRSFPDNLPQQTAEICGSLLVQALETNKNGSLWKISLGNLSEIIPPTYMSPSSRM